jgi:hypothetical protein
MDQTSLFTAALGLQSPWEAVDVRFLEKEHRIDFDVAFEVGSRFTCPKCSADVNAGGDTP